MTNTPRPLRPIAATQYMIFCDFGRAIGRAWVERDENNADLESTIRSLMAVEYDKPLQVVAFDVGEGWCRDVSEDVAREIAARLAGETECHPVLVEFIALHAGERLANELRVAA